MGHVGRRAGIGAEAGDPVELVRRERAARAARNSGGPRAQASRRAPPKSLRLRAQKAPTWLNTAFRVHDPIAVQRLICKALDRRLYYVEWVPANPRGKRLRALWWRKRTPAREAEARQLARSDGISFAKALSNVCGTSLSVELARAAKDFGLSATTLRRLVRGEARSLSWIFHERLRKHLTAAEWASLERALLSPESRQLKNQYVAYIEREIRRFTSLRAAHTMIVVYSDPERRILDSFEQKAKLLGAPAPRAKLAEFRVYDGLVRWEPLHGHLGTGGQAVLRRLPLVRAGFRRELKLLTAEMALLRRAAASS